MDSVSTFRLRAYIREKLGLPTLEDEAYRGDMRATGDALGGHGLQIKPKKRTIEGVDYRLVEFTDENLKKCQQWLWWFGQQNARIIL